MFVGTLMMSCSSRSLVATNGLDSDSRLSPAHTQSVIFFKGIFYNFSALSLTMLPLGLHCVGGC
jgi:hypothetical protein